MNSYISMQSVKSVSDKIYDFGDVLEQSYRTAEPQRTESQRTEPQISRTTELQNFRETEGKKVSSGILALGNLKFRR
jgi:hypothetical protein